MKVDGYSYEAFCRGIVERDGTGCWVARLLVEKRRARSIDYSPGLLECEGEMDGHHWLRKNRLCQELRRAGFPLGPWDSLGAVLSDPRWGSAACRRHHDLLERGLIKPSRAELPLHVDEAAADAGLEGWLDRYYGPRLHGRAA